MNTNITNIFELASNMKFRFPYKGMISTEDLWDLNLDQLDAVYKTLNKDVKKSQEESLLSKNTIEDEVLSAKIEIVRHIFNYKLEMAEKKERAQINAEKKRRILDILAQKQDISLQNMSEDELRKMLEELG